MSLFGAATSGVDPRTGSYLSKEQRIAMFRASQGRGGDEGGSTPSGGKKATVNPQNAIVVANKMASVVQTLQKNTQETVGTVNQQVQQNKQNIENLYTYVQKDREAEAKRERIETRQLKIRRENLLRGARESLVEGLSSALSAASAVGKRALEAVSKPVMSLWQRLFKALTLLGAGWLIDNIDTIEQALKNFGNYLPTLKTELFSSLGNVRGIWSLLDLAFAGIKRGLARMLNVAIDVGAWIARQVGKIVRKVFSKIAGFANDVLNALVRKVSDWFKSFRPPRPPSADPGAITPRGSTSPDGSPRTGAPSGGAPRTTPTPEAPPKGPGGIRGFFKNLLDKVTGKSPQPTPSASGAASGTSAATNAGADASKEATKNRKFFDSIINAFADFFPKIKLPSFMKNAIRGLARVPFIGIAIDSILNSLQGQDPGQAILRGIASGMAGTVGAVAGAKAGAAAGGGLGFFAGGVGAVPGAAIGGVIGGILGAMAAGELGDFGGAKIYEATTGKPAARTEGLLFGDLQAGEGERRGGLVGGISDMVTGAGKDRQVYTPQTASPPSVSPVRAKAPDLSGSSLTDRDSGIEFIEMPPTYETINAPQQQPSPKENEQTIATPSSSDPEMDIYRAMAMKHYQLAIPQ